MIIELVLFRKVAKERYVIGRLSNGEGGYICDTLEPSNCIPEGVYALNISISKHFERYLIHVLNVPGRDGILIHPGNSAEDTTGCILVGYNTMPGILTESQTCEKQVFNMVRMCNEGWLKVTGEPNL